MVRQCGPAVVSAAAAIHAAHGIAALVAASGAGALPPIVHRDRVDSLSDGCLTLCRAHPVAALTA
jgi:hypothetical protein